MNSPDQVKNTESWLPTWFRKSRGAQLATTTIDDCQPHLFEGERDLIVDEMSRATSYLEFGTGGRRFLLSSAEFAVSSASIPIRLGFAKLTKE